MATRDVRLIPKRTAVAGRIPTGTTGYEVSFIRQGELAINTTDQKLFSFDGTNVFEVGAGSFLMLTGGTINGNVGINGDLSATTIYSGSTDLSYLIGTGAAGDITRVQDGLNTYTAGTGNFPTVNVSGLTIDNINVSGSSVFNTLTAVIISGGTIYSGSTDLSELFQAKGEDIYTRIQDGLNTYTGGTSSLPTVNVSGLTVDNITVSGESNFQAVSATTFYSGSTDLSELILQRYSKSVTLTAWTASGASYFADFNHGFSTKDLVVEAYDTTTNLAVDVENHKFFSDDILRVFVDDNTASLRVTVQSAGATTIASGETNSGLNIGDGIGVFKDKSGTNLRFRSLSAGTNVTFTTGDTITINSSGGVGDVTRVQGGTNINTGGTDNYPIINLDNDITLNSVNATTLTGGTIYSGSTDLSNLFAPAGETGDVTRIQGGTNINTGGTDNYPIINLDNDIALNSISAQTISATTLYASGGSIYIGSTKLSELYSNNISVDNGLSATTLSGGTIYSGSTDLSLLIGQGGSDIDWNSGTTRTIYVNESGNDNTGDGSPWNPVATLSYAFANLKASTGITRFILIDTIIETSTLDLSSYDNYVIEGQNGASLYCASATTTLKINASTSISNITIQNLKIENAYDNTQSQAFDFGTSGAGGTLNNIILDSLHLKGRGSSVGIWEIVDNNGAFGDDINIRNITLEWGTKPTSSATSYGILINLQASTNELNIEGFRFVNFGYAEAHSSTVYGVYDFKGNNGGTVRFNNVYANVSPIGTGLKRLITGVGAGSMVTVSNADIYINQGNDISGTLHGIYWAYCYNVRVEIYAEWDDHGSLAETIAIRPLPGSDNCFGKIHNNNTATAQFNYDKTTAGIYLVCAGTVQKSFGLMHGELSLEGQSGDTYTVLNDSLVGAVVTHCAGATVVATEVKAVTRFYRNDVAGTCTFQYFDAIRAYSNGGITDFTIINKLTAMLELKATGLGTPVTLTQCAPLGMTKGALFVNNNMSIGGGELTYTDYNGTGTLADNCVRVRYASGGSGNATLYVSLYKLVRQQISSGVSAGITVSRTNHVTI